jgi:hypothetical protein
VVVQLDSQPNRSFGFQLRRDADATVHAGMLDVLRTAFNRRGRVRLDYQRTGIRNGNVTRVMSLE